MDSDGQSGSRPSWSEPVGLKEGPLSWLSWGGAATATCSLAGSDVPRLEDEKAPKVTISWKTKRKLRGEAVESVWGSGLRFHSSQSTQPNQSYSLTASVGAAGKTVPANVP